MGKRIAAVFLAMVVSAPVAAKDRADSGRYALEKTDDGYLRLDRQTGAVSHCNKPEGGDWTCRAVADDRAALEAEIERMTDDIADLRARLGEDKSTSDRILNLPTRDEVDEMMGFMEDVMKRFKGMVDRLNDGADAPVTPPEPVPDPDPDRT